MFDDIRPEFVFADSIVAVKDIGITYPHVDHWVTYHPERLKRELAQRRQLGYSDPKFIWTYDRIRLKDDLGVPIKRIGRKGGSSGYMGMWVGLEVADKVVLCGIPMDPKMPHYRRPKKRGWPEAEMYRKVWLDNLPLLKDRVRSMSGWTKDLLGAPTADWLSN